MHTANCMMEDAPVAQAPRNVLNSIIADAAKDGLHVKTGIEAEFFLLTPNGEQISDEDIMSREELEEKYKSLQPGDSVRVKFKSEVKEVCQNKGCWMKMDMGSDDVMVRFKDYGFFVPKNIAGQEIIVEGYAFVEEMSVEDQKHYAEDAGESPEELAEIVTPKRTLSFVSSGVLIPEMESPIENQ